MEQEKITFHHRHTEQVRFCDIDMMSHVTNSVYLSFCDDARMTYFEKVLNERIEARAESLVIASITIDFVNPTVFFEKIAILTKVTHIGNKSIQMLQHVINDETGQIKAKVKTVISGFNYVEQKAIVIPDRWKKKMANFDKDVQYKYTVHK